MGLHPVLFVSELCPSLPIGTLDNSHYEDQGQQIALVPFRCLLTVDLEEVLNVGEVKTALLNLLVKTSPTVKKTVRR